MNCQRCGSQYATKLTIPDPDTKKPSTTYACQTCRKKFFSDRNGMQVRHRNERRRKFAHWRKEFAL